MVGGKLPHILLRTVRVRIPILAAHRPRICSKEQEVVGQSLVNNNARSCPSAFQLIGVFSDNIPIPSIRS